MKRAHFGWRCDISTRATEAQSSTSEIRNLILITGLFGIDSGYACSFHIEHYFGIHLPNMYI